MYKARAATEDPNLHSQQREKQETLVIELFTCTESIMAQLDYADAVAIFQLVYYSPCLIGSIFVAGRNGAQKSSGWFFLCIFGLVRIIGAAARLATISHPKTDTAYTIALVCSELGLSPLLMASLGLLSRAYVNYLSSRRCGSNLIQLLLNLEAAMEHHLLTRDLQNRPYASSGWPDTMYRGRNRRKDACRHRLTEHRSHRHRSVCRCLGDAPNTYCRSSLCQTQDRTGEGLLIFAVMCALPFLAVRLLYALISAFAHSRAFSPITGSTTSETVALFMSVVMEMAVVVIYIATGLRLSAVPAGAADGPVGTMAYRFGRGDFGTGKLGILSTGTAAIQASRRGDV